MSMTENTTHYILTQLSQMVNNNVQLNAKNSLSTYDAPQYSIVLMQGGYPVQQNTIDVGVNVPVVLGCVVNVNNRTVNIITNATITCDRNNNG
jgi:hypothetical protein